MEIITNLGVPVSVSLWVNQYTEIDDLEIIDKINEKYNTNIQDIDFECSIDLDADDDDEYWLIGKLKY